MERDEWSYIDSPLLTSSFVAKTIANDSLVQLITKRSKG